jgi:rhodanese-related sulfurtransferase
MIKTYHKMEIYNMTRRGNFRWCVLLFTFILLNCLITVKAQIIVDHTCIDLSKVPTNYIMAGKGAFRFWYMHTSHGSQLSTGMSLINQPPTDYNEDGSGGALSYNDFGDSDLGTEGDTAWVVITKQQLDSPTNNRNVVMWSWCGGVSGNTEDGINIYLNAMDKLENDYPGVKFIYMTGHLDGTGSTGNLHIRNEQIRKYCQDNKKILFDFADIERFNPDGTDFLDLGATDGCDYSGGNWADEWTTAHPTSPLSQSCGLDDCCVHSKPLNCNMKGRVFWWMVARMAGWDGVTTPTQTPIPTYTNITAAQAKARKDAGEDICFLDVREQSERVAGHIPDDINMPWTSGYLQLNHTLLPLKPIIVYCASGGRSPAASQFLVDNGHTNIFNMLGGYTAWLALPTGTPTPTPTATPIPTSTPTPTPSPGPIIHVPEDYKTIQEAIDASTNGTTIIVSPKRYPENISFNGKNIHLRSTEPDNLTVRTLTIIDGQSLGPVVTFTGNENTSCILSGFTITGGRAITGGGILGNTCNATIRNNIITSNTAYSEQDSSIGGGIYDCYGLIENNLITKNSAGNYGGGISNCFGTIRKNKIMFNTCTFNGGGLEGCGGIIEHNIITHNIATDGGGLTGCNGDIRNNIIAFNRADWGGGLSECNATIINNTIYRNSALNAGALSSCNAGITNCIIWDNPSSDSLQLDKCTTPNWCDIEGWSGAGEGNKKDPPLMENPEAGDFHLKSESPCIDAGYPDEQFNDSCLPPGMNALRGDMGAYGGPYNCGWLPENPRIIVSLILGRESLSEKERAFYDLNGDGVINVCDLILFILNNTGTKP